MIASFSIEPAWLGWVVFVSAPLGYVMLVASYFTLDKRYELKSEAVSKARELSNALHELSVLQKAIDDKMDTEIKEILSTLKSQEAGVRNSVDKLSESMNSGFLRFATNIGMMQGQLNVLIGQGNKDSP